MPLSSSETEKELPTEIQDAESSSTASSPVEPKDEDTPKSMLEAVTKAAKGDTEEDGEPSDPQKSQKTDEEKPKGDADEAEELGEITDEELKSYKPKTAKRIKQLLAKNEALNNSLKEAGVTPEDLKTVKENADAMTGFMGFVRNAGLSTEEVNNGMEIMRLMKHDPVKALEALKPYYEALNVAIGEVMPTDLQQAVDQGSITEEYAKELSRQRSKASLATDAATRATQSESNSRLTAQRETFANSQAQAITDWERQWEKSDPDFKLKAPRVLDKLQVELLRGNIPKTQQGLIDLAEKIKKDVEAETKSFIPKRKANVPLNAGAGSNRSTPEPKSMLDVVRQSAKG